MVLQNSHRHVVMWPLDRSSCWQCLVEHQSSVFNMWVAWMIDIVSDHLKRTSITYDWLGTMFDPSVKKTWKRKVCLFLFAMYRNNSGFYWTEARSNFDGHVHTSPSFMVEHITFPPHLPTLNQQILPYLASELRGLNVWIWRNHRARREIHTSMAVCFFLLWRDEMCWLQ